MRALARCSQALVHEFAGRRPWSSRLTAGSRSRRASRSLRTDTARRRVLVGKGDDLAAELLGSASLQDDFVDHYRASDARFDYALEERWVRDEGYLQIVPRAIAAVCAEAGIAAAAVDRFILQGPARFATGVAKSAGLRPEAIQDDLHGALRQHGRGAPVAAARRGARDGGGRSRSCCWRVSARVATHCCCARPVVRPQPGAASKARLPTAVADRDYLRFLANCGAGRNRLGHARRA